MSISSTRASSAVDYLLKVLNDKKYRINNTVAREHAKSVASQSDSPTIKNLIDVKG